MSDENEHDDVEANDPAGIRKALEKANKRVRELEEANAKLSRESLFTQAGVPNEGPGKWFRKGYDGELTLEAIKAAAEADNLFSPKAEAAGEPEEPEVPADEVAAHAAMQQARNGGALPNSGSAEDQLLAAIAQAKSSDEIGQIMAAAGRRVV